MPIKCKYTPTTKRNLAYRKASVNKKRFYFHNRLIASQPLDIQEFAHVVQVNFKVKVCIFANAVHVHGLW